MTTEDPHGRLRLVNPSEFTPEQRGLYDGKLSKMVAWAEGFDVRSRTASGELLGPFNALLYSAEPGDALLAYLQAVTRATPLTPKLREVVILTVGAIWHSAYELSAHQAVAHSVGVDNDDIALMSAGKPPVNLGPEGVLTQRFVLAIMKDHQIPDELYAEAAALFGDKALIDMIHLAGVYTTVCALINAFRIPAG